MDIDRIKKIYMIGIKGVGMAMLAQYLKGKGYDVSGSDTSETFMTDKALRDAGILFYEGFSAGNLPVDADLIIYSTAYNAQRNVEVAKALGGKIKTIEYAKALGMFFNRNYGIAVAGSHGKTTTTAWLGYVMREAGLSPNVLVGSVVGQFNGSSLVGNSDYMVAETDEYQNKLEHFDPKMIMLNNIDYDHPDFFPSVDSYEQVFAQFIQKLSKNGILIANFDDASIRRIARVNTKGKVVSYAIGCSADFVGYDIMEINNTQHFKVKMRDGAVSHEDSLSSDADYDELGDFSIRLAGKHNISNALAVISASVELGIPLTDLRKGLSGFEGTSRRMEVMGEYRGALVIDDYAHHPTEIKATIQAARSRFLAGSDKRLIVVFHPHTFTRTKTLLEEFSKSFGGADELLVLDIYGSAREIQGGITSNDLLDKIVEHNKSIASDQSAKYIPDMDTATDYLRENAGRGDVILLMGAGDVFRIGKKLTSNLQFVKKVV